MNEAENLTLLRRARAKAEALKPRICWVWHEGVKHVLSADFYKDPAFYPQLDSDEWIEYIAPDVIVERDDDLWWRAWDEAIDGFRYTQLTKGSSCKLPSTPTGSR
jgi:hypothetical protein